MAERQQRRSREEVAKEEIGRTDVSPAISVILATLFLATVAAVPLIQHIDDTAQFMRGARPGWVPQCYSILRGLPECWRVLRTTPGSVASRVVAANRHLLRDMRHYEDTQEESSWLTRVSLPRAQWVLTRWLGVGNEKVYLGTGGWLFYRPDVDYLTGPGFLSRRHFENRLRSGEEWEPTPQPDPVRAIMDFDGKLKARGIRLIVMPTPMKPMIHPGKLASTFRRPGTVVQNVSFAPFIQQLRANGVQVFDCSGLLAADHLKTGQPQYLMSDTHWRPEAMCRVAQDLAALVQEAGQLSPAAATGYQQEPAELSSVGDIRSMLKLPDDSGPNDLETVQIQQVLSPDSELWKPDRKAEVLVLGDSFSNIYSMPSMGWGEAAGLAEQLSFYLHAPVDRISQNDNGAFATRETLLRETTQGRDRLIGKRVVIWQFASRELAFGDWKIIPIGDAPLPSPADAGKELPGQKVGK